MTKKVCLVGPVFPYRGGIAHFTSELAKEFGREHDVLIINFKRLYPSFLFPGKTQFDSSGEPLDTRSVRMIDSMNPLTSLAAARAVKSFNPDLIVFQWWQPFFAFVYATMVFALGRDLRERVVFLCHNVLPHERSLVDSFLIRLGFARVGRFLLQSREDRDNLLKLKKHAVVAVHPHPIYDTFNRGRYDRQSARSDIGVEGRVALFFGLIRSYKGLGVLLDAFALARGRVQATLLVVGEFYEDSKPYLSQIEQLKLQGDVRVVNEYIPNEEVEKYFAACDFVVLPYLSATQSGITQIAFAFDKPVVVTAVGGLPDVVDDDVTGYVVPPNDREALAEAIVKIFDGDNLGRLEAGVAKAKHRFSWRRCTELLGELVLEPQRR